MDSREVRMVAWVKSPRMAVSMRGVVRRVRSGWRWGFACILARWRDSGLGSEDVGEEEVEERSELLELEDDVLGDLAGLQGLLEAVP